MGAAITAQDLRKSFRLSAKQRKIERTDSRMKTAVDGLSFEVQHGEIFGLLGPNGAGKTTTLRMLAALVKPDQGDAFIDGKSVVSDPVGVRSSIGFLTSDLKLEDVFSPDYLFDFFSELHRVDPAVRDERKRALFERFGIDRFAQTKVADLSTGMKQKTSLAVSVAHDPSIIVFDEPTNGLDVLTAKTVTDFLVEMKGEGKTILLSTHIFTLVEKVCDRVGIVIDGRMAACGTLPDVTHGRSLEDAFFDLYAAAVRRES
ncbi:MAG: ABC transporter ATP-binding protein NatA [Paraeggerthella hongkongensis]|uniref:ABC transporter ATP-binding protein n=1 Tax=Paraeggerthella TaxID=651554 RepID=UPI001C10D81D|nr:MULTISPECIES: ABC transporter ATP-binding protein [Paraeggerthella]MBU5406350.1 ABC transporter ATP-binding protein [Paraeggerthella hongkongensis]MCD2433033.1 ABC transporter ATP-binding protein [Paraeggerthella hominis]